MVSKVATHMLVRAACPSKAKGITPSGTGTLRPLRAGQTMRYPNRKEGRRGGNKRVASPSVAAAGGSEGPAVAGTNGCSGQSRDVCTVRT